MTSLWFLISLAAIVFAVLAIETDEGRPFPLQRPTGLITWLARGNWPAKVGSALVVVGVGALLRYALITIDVPPPVKLSGGIVLAMGLGLAAFIVPADQGRRAVSLALGGAAFGVAYLTAYSAFALFGYFDNPTGIGLLGVTAAAAGAYAVTRSALSLALLSMVGAYLAPAFALTDPGPAVVYGYYIGASLLTLAMVVARGWHPLIHLSFVFTLVGGAFFAWTSRYYGQEHAGVMLPMILLLSAVHVIMPIVERTAARAPWIQKLDLAYTIALPAVAAVLCVVLAPDRATLAGALLVLASIWVVAAAVLLVLRREGVVVYGAIAGLLFVLAVAAWFRDLPWELLSLGMSVAALAISARMRTPAGRLHGVLAGLVVLFGAVHILVSAVAADAGDVFLSGDFIERLIGAALLIYAGVICRRIGQPLDTMLLALGIVWGAVALAVQVVRWDLATVALVAHWALLLVAVSLWIPGRKVLVADRHVGLLALLILVTAFWGATDLPNILVTWSSYLAASLALIGLAVRPTTVKVDPATDRLVAAMVAPWAATIWGAAGGRLIGINDWQFALLAGAAAVIFLLLAVRFVRDDRTVWLDAALEVYGPALGAVVALATLVDIAPGAVPVALEFVCLGALLLIARMRFTRALPHAVVVVACVVGAALILQANLMRLLGPPGHLDLSDLMSLRWPAVISLVWVVAGCALTITSRRFGSRTAWVAGAALLVAAAAKLMILDFGSLGEIANILAVIVAGVVFLLVGWLAPMPPAATRARQASTASDGSDLRRLGGTITAVLGVLALTNYSRITSEVRFREFVRGPVDTAEVVVAAPGSPADPEAEPEIVAAEGGTDTASEADMEAQDDAEPSAADQDEPWIAAPPPDVLGAETASFASEEHRETQPTPDRVATAESVNPETGTRVFTQYSTPALSARRPVTSYTTGEYGAPELPGLPPVALGAPVHFVGAYQGTEPKGRPGDMQRIVVNVKGSGGPIVLVLSSYESVEWVVARGGHRVAAVLLSGYEQSSVSLSGDVPVLRIGTDYAYSPDGPKYAMLRRTVSRYTGSPEISSFQGSYTGGEFSVGP